MSEIMIDITKDLLRHEHNLKYLYNGLEKTRKLVNRLDSKVGTLTLGFVWLGYYVYKQQKHIEKLEKSLSKINSNEFAEDNKKG